MDVKVESTTDSSDDVIAAQGNLSSKEKVETKVETKKETPASDKSDEKELSASETDTSDADETDDKDSDDESEDLEDKPKKKKGGFKRRIDKLNSRLTEREKELAYWREQAINAQKPQEREAKAESPKPQSSDRPDPDNFETFAEYTDALTDWKFEQREAKTREAKQSEERKKLIEAHNSRVESYAKSQDDFWDVIEDVDDIEASPALTELILESENGPALMYEIAKNRQEFERINVLGPIAAAREIGKIEARLSLSQAQQTGTKKSTITKASAPLKTVGNKSSGGSTKSPDEMDYHEYKKWREANL